MNLFLLEVQSPESKFKNISFVIQNENSKHALVIDPAWQIELFEKCFKENNIKKDNKVHILELSFIMKFRNIMIIKKDLENLIL